MKQQQSLVTLFLLFLNCANILAQSPAAAPAQPPSRPISQPPASSPTQVPAGPAPTNVTKILEKAGHFSIFIRLLKSTQEENHLLTVLNNSNNGLTIIAPTDNAFSSLKAGTLNVLTNEQKAELVKFHEIPTFLSMSQFQTVTNPVATEAGSGGRVGLNVTSYPASVNITTGLTNTSLSGTVYTDNQLAIYKVEKVLLPMDVLTPKALAPAPTPEAENPKKKKAPVVEEDSSPAVPAVETSTASSFIASHSNAVIFGLGMLTALL